MIGVHHGLFYSEMGLLSLTFGNHVHIKPYLVIASDYFFVHDVAFIQDQTHFQSKFIQVFKFKPFG